FFRFFSHAPAPSVIYALSLHDALPICQSCVERIQTGGNLHSLYFINSVSVSHVYAGFFQGRSSVGELVLDYQVLRSFCVYERSKDRKSTRLNSSHVSISYAVFCLKKKK